MTVNVSPADPNPAVSAEITGDIKGNRVNWLEVEYKLLDGQIIRGGDPYTNARIWTENGSILWSGAWRGEAAFTVEGRLRKDQGVYYSEVHFRNGAQDSSFATACVKADDGDNSAAKQL